MDYIGLSELSMMFLHKAERTALDSENMRITALQLHEHADIYESLALYYEKQMGYDTIDSDLYQKIIDNYENAIKIEPNNSRILYNFAEFWSNIGEIEQMVKYFKMAAKNGDIISMLELARFYYDKNIALFIHYHLMIIQCDDPESSLYTRRDGDLYYEYIERKMLEVYEKLQQKPAYFALVISSLVGLTINETKKYIEKNVTKLRNVPSVASFINKVTLFTRLNNIHECIICYDTKVNICLDCGHELCVDCYKRTDVCYYCRF